MDIDDRALHRIKLSDLRLFRAAVQRGGMAKAAAHLHISQPAVSKAIAALEHTLGVRLLERQAQGVQPTSYGRALLTGAIAVFDELKQSAKQITFLADPSIGELRIGCTEPLAAGFIPSVIGRILRQHPMVRFHVVTADPARLVERELVERNIDLAIAPISGLASDPAVAVEVVFDDRQLVMAAPQNKWLRRRNVALADIVDEPWILPPLDSIIGASIVEVFRRNGLQPPRKHVVTFSIPLCHQLLTGQGFLAMFPVSMARLQATPMLKILDVGFHGITRPTGIMTLKKRTASPLAELFISAVRELASKAQSARRRPIGGRNR
jgi:DNA-binding transcriptional LysR family regulator